ncbi:MAG: MgtC/SapB family protein [Anaerolineae bacterium]|nr:MgtC/SapB family protein [Anaerolineae bacterium]
MDQATLFSRFGVALAIGFLIGLQREYAHSTAGEVAAGVRTFTLLSLAGCAAALLADYFAAPSIFLAVAFSLSLFLGVAYAFQAGRGDFGMTTEVAALLTVLLGGLCYAGQLTLAIAGAVVTTLVLTFKLELHTFAHRLARDDLYALLRFAAISALILPILPNQSYGQPPFDVLNPYKIWLMVVFISGISFLGYLLNKVVGPRRGITLTGILGGLVSSTAVTLTFTERSQREAGLSRPFALAIVGAWTVMFARILTEVAALNQPLLSVVWRPLLAAGAVGLVYSVWLYRTQRTDGGGEVSLNNPFELGSALRFGLLYAVILVISRAAQLYLGTTGLYASSLLAGLTDVDAITLSMADLSQPGRGVDLDTAARAITLAATSNTLVKGGIVLLSGSPGLWRVLMPALALILSSGLAVAFLG